MLLTIGLVMIVWAVILGIKSPVKYPPKDPKERPPVEYTPDFTNWRQHIFDLRNGRK